MHVLAPEAGLDFQEVGPLCQVEAQGGKWWEVSGKARPGPVEMAVPREAAV